MSLPRYSRYRDSCVQWLGMVPDHWVVTPFKWVIERNDGGVWGDEPDGISDTLVLRSTEQTVDGRWKLDDPAPRKLTDSERTFALLQDGDLIVTKSSGSSLHIGKTTLVTEDIAQLECCYSNFMQRIRLLDSFLPKLAWFVMNNDLARLQFDLLSNSTTGLANLNSTMIGQIVLPVAPLPEQRDILTFLDRETSKIDVLILEQEKLITLLAEKRQATISRAVTKGLNPTAPLKDSGVEWLGEVPEHWEVGSIKKWFSTSSGGTPDTGKHDIYYTDDGGFPWIRTTDLNNDVLDAFEISITEEAIKNTACKMLPSGSVLLAMYGGDGTIGKNALLGFDACINQAVCALIPNQAFLSEFTFRYVQFYRPYWMIGAESSRKDPNIGQALIQNTKIPRPPADEQMQIVSFLRTEICRLDALSAEARRGIELLNERRSALISAAVTGKIDVRETAQRDQVTIQEAA